MDIAIMYIKLGVFLLLVPNALYGAQVVTFGAALCDVGQHMINGDCEYIARNDCPAGYYQTAMDIHTYSAPTLQMQCMNTYNRVEIPDGFHPIYSGMLVNFGPQFCGPNELYGNGKCQPRSQGRCPDGYYKTLVSKDTLVAPSVDLGECMNSYNPYDLPKQFASIYNGIVVSFGPTLCGAGQYMSGNTCVPLMRGGCPANFHVAGVDETTIIPYQNNACAAGYAPHWLTTNCADSASGTGLCAVLCGAGLRYTGVGTCANTCNAGVSMLKTSTGLGWTLYSAAQTTPAINIRVGEDVCYVNLVPGVSSGTINVKLNDKSYHVVD